MFCTASNPTLIKASVIALSDIIFLRADSGKRVMNAEVHASASDRRMAMCRVARKQNATLAVGDGLSYGNRKCPGAANIDDSQVRRNRRQCVVR